MSNKTIDCVSDVENIGDPHEAASQNVALVSTQEESKGSEVTDAAAEAAGTRSCPEQTPIVNSNCTLDLTNVGSLILSSLLQNVTDQQKMELIQHHFVPGKDFSFPKEHMNSCNRSFSAAWLSMY